MLPKPNQFKTFVYGLITALLLFACRNNLHDIPFPENDNRVLQPPAEPFKLTAPQPAEWTTLNADSLKKLSATRPFSIDQLPGGDLTIAKEMPLPAPLEQTKLVWDTIIHFNVDTIPSHKYQYSFSVLGVPKKIRSEIPRPTDNASENILVFGQEQGLPDLSVNTIMEDHIGNMWLATLNGLCVFDGTSSIVYTTEQGLSNNNYNFLAEDKMGRIWAVNNKNRIDIIDRKASLVEHLDLGGIWKVSFNDDGTVIATSDQTKLIDPVNKTYKLLGGGEGIPNLTRAINRSADGTTWIFGEGNFYKLDLRKGTNYVLTDSVFFGPHPDSYTLVEDKHGVTWSGTNNDNFVFAIDPIKNICYKMSTAQGLTEGFTQELRFNKHGELMIAALGGGFFIYNPEKQTIKKLAVVNGLTTKYIKSVYEDRSGRIWLGTMQNEAMIYNAENIPLINVTGKQGLLNNSQKVTALVEDDMGNKWIGMNYFGVNVIQPDGKVRLLTQQQGLQRIENFRSMYKDSKGRIWITDYDAAERIDLKKGEMKSILKTQGKMFKPPTYGFMEMDNGDTWIGYAKGIYSLSENMDSFRHIEPRAGSSSNAAFMMLKVNEDEIWVGTGRGISVINRGTNQIRRASAKDLDSANINGLLLDTKKRVWAATAAGIFIIDLKAGSCQHLTEADGLPNDYVTSILEKDRKFFIGTGTGMCVLDPINDNTDQKGTGSWRLYSLSKPMGFSRADFTSSAMMDKNGFLWWGNGIGLTGLKQFKIDTASPITHITGINIGEQSYSFANRKWLQEKLGENDSLQVNNKLYAGTGLPKDSGFLAGSGVKWDSISGPYALPVNLELPHGQNHVTFFFSMLPSTSWEQTRFRFILQGADKDWNESTGQPYADYRNLSPGSYRFVVRSKGVNGKWSEPDTLEFKVLPPWWKTWWAYVLYTLIALTGVVMYSRYRSRKLKEENIILEEKITSRTAELHESIRELKATQSQLIQSEKMASLGELTAGIAHEIQNPLNFVNNFSEVNSELIDEMQEELEKGNLDDARSIAKDIKENEQKIKHHGKRADSIVKGMLQHSRNSSGQKEMTDINALVDECMRLSYHGLRAKDKSFNAKTTEEFDNTLTRINIASQDVGRVIINLFTNAFYSVMQKKKMVGEGYEPSVTAKTSRTAKGVSISIRDNGTGIPQKVIDKIFQPFFTTKPVGEGTGLGLSMSYEIITKGHGGELKVVTKEGEGAEFIINLPG